MARHFILFDLLVLTGILAFLYDFFLLGLALGNVRPLSVITFGCLIGVYFYLVFVLPTALEDEHFKEDLEHEFLKIKMGALVRKWEDDGDPDPVVDEILRARVKEVRALLGEDLPREVEAK